MRRLRTFRRFILTCSLCFAPIAALAPASSAQIAIGVSVHVGPPALPVYTQPPCPGDGYLWTPGYWAYGPVGYYWVPGVWVTPPRVGVLWTPGYWAFVGGVYAFHPGYWGPHVGFYGGVNYGFGYVGVGFAGGRWVGNSFAYNRSVANINVTVVHNTYNETVVNNVTVNRVSYNGGGGIAAVPTPQERMAAQEPHVAVTPMQRQHIQEAAKNPALFAKANGGRPSVAATPRPAVFNAPGVVGARGAATPPVRPAEAVRVNNATGAPPAAGPTNGARTPAPNAAAHAQVQGQGQTKGQALNGKPPSPKPHPKAPPKKRKPEPEGEGKGEDKGEAR